jgi:phage gp45-like
MKKGRNRLRFGRLKSHGKRGEVQVEGLEGEIHSGLRHPQPHGLESRAPIESESYTAYQDSPDNGATLIIAGQAPITLSDGDTVIYNNAGVTVHLNGSTVEISANTDITGDLTATGNVSDSNATTATMAAMRALFNTHTHTAPLTPPTQQM